MRNQILTKLLNLSNYDLDSTITAVQNLEDSNEDTSKEVEAASDRHTEATETNNSFNFDSIDRSKLQAITLRLRKQGILDADETLEQWLSEMMPQITEGKNLTVPELLAGLKQFLEL